MSSLHLVNFFFPILRLTLFQWFSFFSLLYSKLLVVLVVLLIKPQPHTDHYDTPRSREIIVTKHSILHQSSPQMTVSSPKLYATTTSGGLKKNNGGGDFKAPLHPHHYHPATYPCSPSFKSIFLCLPI